VVVAGRLFPSHPTQAKRTVLCAHLWCRFMEILDRFHFFRFMYTGNGHVLYAAIRSVLPFMATSVLELSAKRTSCLASFLTATCASGAPTVSSTSIGAPSNGGCQWAPRSQKCQRPAAHKCPLPPLAGTCLLPFHI
jgi:hypothetical protein